VITEYLDKRSQFILRGEESDVQKKDRLWLWSVPVQSSDLKQAWSYRSDYAPNESKKGYIRFISWVNDGEKRDLLNTARFFSVNLQTLARQAKLGNWIERLRLYEEFAELKAAEKAREKRYIEHTEKLEAFRARSEAIGGGLVSASAQLLAQATRAIQEIKESGNVLDPRLIAGALNAASKCAESGRLLAAQSLGIDSLLIGISEDGDSSEYS
jgi:hypothetical protein